MAKIQLEISSCSKCPHWREANPWSSDGWDRMIDWFCSATATPESPMGRKIRGAVEWHEEKKIAIPNWCPIKVPRAEPLRLIGLDLDGVVVTEKHAAKMYKEGHALGTAAYLQPELIALVDQIAERAKAEILLTTAWQAKLSVEKITEMLVAQGLKAKIFGGVGTAHRGSNDDTRYQATNNWLVRYPEVQSIVLLDDEPWKWNQLKVGTPTPLPHDPSVASFQRPLLDAGNGLVSWNEPGWLKHKLVLTSWEQGIQQHHVDLAVDILLDPSRGGVLPKKNV
jgi:hypothetical protein